MRAKLNKNKETCCLCGKQTSNFRWAYRNLREHSVNRDGFYPTNRFSYEEINKMQECAYNPVCSNRATCQTAQIADKHN